MKGLLMARPLRRRLVWFGVALAGSLIGIVALNHGFTVLLRKQPRRTMLVVRKLFGRVVNPLLLWVTGRIHREPSVVYHVGRVSGREYVTPLCVSGTTAGFIVPVAFGPEVDWLANLRANPDARLRHEGVEHDVQAEVINAAEALRLADGIPGCPCWEELAIQQFVLLRPSPGDAGGAT